MSQSQCCNLNVAVIDIPPRLENAGYTEKSMLKVSTRFIAATSLCFFTSIGPSASAQTAETVNYDDPNLAISNDFVADNASTCPKTLKGKVLQNCLERLGIQSSEVAQVTTSTGPSVPEEASPLTQQRSRSAR